MNISALILGTIAALASFVAMGSEGWTGGMEDGSVVRIDPDSNQATRYSGEGAIQLWDGVHRMQDGSTVTVKDGVVTSRSAGDQRTPQFAPAPTDPGLTPSACVALVVKVCGFNGECRDDPACSPARQLMELEKSEAWQSKGAGPNQTTAQCLNAMENEAFFSPCSASAKDAAPTACDRLVERACGADQQCAQTPDCLEAQQFQRMEQREQARNRHPEKLTPASEHCEEILRANKTAGFCEDD